MLSNTPPLPGRYQNRRPTLTSRLGARAVEALRSYFNDFLGASMAFSIAMLIAVLCMSAKGTTAQRRSPLGTDAEVPMDSALYYMMISMLAATFSIFPVIILYAMQRHARANYRSRRGRNGSRFTGQCWC